MLPSSIMLLCAYFGTYSVKAGLPHWSVGTSTNLGIYATGADVDSYEHRITIIIHFTPPSTNIGISPFMHFTKGTNGIGTVTTPLRNGRFFWGTNSFCGFVELRDADGVKVRLLKPEINDPAAYPNSYRLKIVGRLDDDPVAPHELPLALSGVDASQAFYIKDYFKIKEPGDYQLTVWPKIYKRLGTNDDLCVRMDIPPVTIPIHWAGNSQ
jgi:hypothetical protein